MQRQMIGRNVVTLVCLDNELARKRTIFFAREHPGHDVTAKQIRNVSTCFEPVL
jgi:hypothetical protein